MHYRSVWISDMHLGSRGCRAAELSRFLKYLRCERLYLVGDVLDLWRLRNRWYWPAEHNDVIRRLLNHARHHCQVIYLPGNHDAAIRHFVNLNFGGIRTLPYAIHVTADGRRLLVIHGDQFDLVVRHSQLVAMLGGKAYETLLSVNRCYNTMRRRLGLPYASLSQSIKMKVKTACMFISRFEQALAREAHRRGLDGVVCGHIHKPQIIAPTRGEARFSTPGAPASYGDVAYYNCGDWVESCSALVEHADGRIEVLEHLDRFVAPERRNDGESADEPMNAALFDPFAMIDFDPLNFEHIDQEQLTFGNA
ncbi:MAG: UDP-2,3-diacylglucosamine diphosphatase [Phycisphaeraceae bacterium]|nr:UDP-2,3-diacylglucosamine diphosphatase [Phycisphaeraceae bacterium]